MTQEKRGVSPREQDTIEGLVIGDVLHVVSISSGQLVDALIGPSRTALLTHARHIAMYLARRHTANSLSEIGKAFGYRDHTTVLYGVKRIAEQAGDDPNMARFLERLKGKLVQRVGGRSVHGAGRKVAS